MRLIVLFSLIGAAIGAARVRRQSTQHSLSLNLSLDGNNVVARISISQSSQSSNIMRYVLQYRKVGSPDWINVADQTVGSSPALSHQISRLEWGQDYEFEIQLLDANRNVLNQKTLQIRVPDQATYGNAGQNRQQGPNGGNGQALNSQPEVQTRTDLPPPRNLKVFLSSNNAVHLRWEGDPYRRNPMYSISTHIVGTHTFSSEMFTSDTMVTLTQMRPATTYLIKIKLKVDNAYSHPAEAQIQMPNTATRVVVPAGMSLKKSTTGNPDDLLLMWKVADGDRNMIRAYDLYYSNTLSVSETSAWKVEHVEGSNPTHTLRGVVPGAKYYMYVATHFNDAARYTPTMSSLYSFEAPEVEYVKSIQLTSKRDGGMELAWDLNPTLDSSQIEGYRVLVSTNRDTPEDTWRPYIVDRPGVRQVYIPAAQIQPNSEYFVRIHPRLHQRGLVQSKVLFTFRTREQQSPNSASVNPAKVAYRIQYTVDSPNTYKLVWQVPSEMRTRVQETRIRYNSNLNSDISTWPVVRVLAPETQAILPNVDTSRSVYVRFQSRTNEAWSLESTFELKPLVGTFIIQLTRVQQQTSPQQQQQQQRTMTACNPQANPSQCIGTDEVCVATCTGNTAGQACYSGLCMARSVIQQAAGMGNGN